MSYSRIQDDEDDLLSSVQNHSPEQQGLLSSTTTSNIPFHNDHHNIWLDEMDESHKITGQHGVGSALGGIFFGWQFVLSGGFFMLYYHCVWQRIFIG